MVPFKTDVIQLLLSSLQEIKPYHAKRQLRETKILECMHIKHMHKIFSYWEKLNNGKLSFLGEQPLRNNEGIVQ